MKECSLVVVLLLLSGFAIHVPIPTVSSTHFTSGALTTGTFEKFGSRVDNILFRVGASAYEFETGQIDVMDQLAPREKWTQWLMDSEIVMEEFNASLTICFFGLDNQIWPIGHGTMAPEGWNGSEPAIVTGHQWINYTCQRCLDSREFRRALAHLTDKTIWPAPKETFIPIMLQEWENPNVTTYEFNLNLAIARLNASGFNDYDGDVILEYSPSHATFEPGQPPPADMEELPTIQLYIRRDNPDMRYCGEQLLDYMIALGISVTAPEIWIPEDPPKFHIYTDKITFNLRNPSECYEIFCSEYQNYVDFYSREFDFWFKELKCATSMDEANETCYMCQEIIARDVASIPHYALSGYVAHRTRYGYFVGEERYSGLNWSRFVNELGVGFHSFGTHLNARPQGYDRGGVLRQGLRDGWALDRLNPVHSELSSDWLVLSRIYEPLLMNDPYNDTKKTHWLTQSYEVGTWASPSGTAAKIKFRLLPNILWHDNQPLTAEDVAFTLQYMKDSLSARFCRYVEELDHAEVLDKYTVIIYYKVQSIWALDWASCIPIIPKHIWQEIPPSQSLDEGEFQTTGKLTGSGPFRFVGFSLGLWLLLEDNPTYFRKLVQPDFVTEVGGTIQPGQNGIVDIDDVGMVIGKLGDALPWSDPKWGPVADVNKDLFVDIDDIMETIVRYGQTGYENGYPQYYGADQ